MKINATAIKAAAVVVAGVGLYYLYVKASGKVGALLDSARQTFDETAAAAASAWQNNIVAPFEAGQLYATTGQTRQLTEKERLYGDAGYTGIDPQTGLPVIDGEWYGNADARRYDVEQRERGAAPAATSINGAAFGYYPNMPSAANRDVLLQLQTRGRVVGGL